MLWLPESYYTMLAKVAEGGEDITYAVAARNSIFSNGFSLVFSIS